MDLRLPFGLRDENLIHISEAQQGLACRCLCPSCKSPLIARKGSIIAHHFAHHNVSECSGAVETAIHLASKQLLLEHRKIALPAVQIRFHSYRSSIPLSDERIFPLEEIHEESRTGSITPDILAYSHGLPLIIEIRVTHEVDEIKLSKIRHLGISAIEIDLSSISRNFPPEALTDAIINSTKNKKWLFNAKAEKFRQLFLQSGEKKKSIRRGLALHVDYCPIKARTWKGKPYANLIDDCLGCEFILEVEANMNGIICGGRHKIRTLDELKRFYKQSEA